MRYLATLTTWLHRVDGRTDRVTVPVCRAPGVSLLDWLAVSRSIRTQTRNIDDYLIAWAIRIHGWKCFRHLRVFSPMQLLLSSLPPRPASVRRVSFIGHRRHSRLSTLFQWVWIHPSVVMRANSYFPFLLDSIPVFFW